MSYFQLFREVHSSAGQVYPEEDRNEVQLNPILPKRTRSRTFDVGRTKDTPTPVSNRSVSRSRNDGGTINADQSGSQFQLSPRDQSMKAEQTDEKLRDGAEFVRHQSNADILAPKLIEEKKLDNVHYGDYLILCAVGENAAGGNVCGDIAVNRVDVQKLSSKVRYLNEFIQA